MDLNKSKIRLKSQEEIDKKLQEFYNGSVVKTKI